MGAFRIQPQNVKAKAEIPAMFTQGYQVFRNIKEKGDMVVALRDNYDKRVGNYIQKNNLTNLEYYPKINTKSGLDDEKPEGLRLNIENPIIESNKSFTKIRDNQKGRTIEVIATNPATSYVYVKPDSLNENSTKCIINTKGQIIKTFTTPKDISKFMKMFREMKNKGINILV